MGNYIVLIFNHYRLDDFFISFNTEEEYKKCLQDFRDCEDENLYFSYVVLNYYTGFVTSGEI